MNLFRCTLISVFSLLLCSSASAHKIWLNPADHFPDPGSTVEIGIGWGHKYLADRNHEELKKGMPENIQAIDPDGKTVELTKLTNDSYSLAVSKSGAYLVTTKGKSGFFTTTPEGRKWGNKTEIADAVECTRYHLSGKTAITVGDSNSGFDRVAGQTIELIPLTNPGKLNKGDAFKVRLLLEGKPVPGVLLKASYAGFEKEEKKKEEGKEGKATSSTKMLKESKPFPAEATTDAQGEAELKLNHTGYWMVSFSHKPPYPDLTVCDQYMYNASFTFQVR
ncbi:DUF4198 domain-containing protein [Desulfobulbus sp. TB]|nr:DUF4198 domain-containing protein [Desulfobulbus sp. TB]